jgi:hypothetical protein
MPIVYGRGQARPGLTSPDRSRPQGSPPHTARLVVLWIKAPDLYSHDAAGTAATSQTRFGIFTALAGWFSARHPGRNPPGQPRPTVDDQEIPRL